MNDIEKYYVGQTAHFSKTITESDIYTFAGITGDFNEIHVNKICAEKSMFGRRVAHGMLVASFISTCIALYLPGSGTIYMSQDVTFLKPVFIDDTITACVEIIGIDSHKHAELQTTVRNQYDEIVISGKAKVKLPV